MSKTTVKAELILGSLNAATGDCLWTFLLTFPRPILAEVNTHRVASRNTSSSRAIPGWKMRLRVWADCFIPTYMGNNQRGMQAGQEIEGLRRKLGVGIIKAGSWVAIAQSFLLEKLGFHKQVSNRYLEPYSWCQQVFSATDVSNLFLLRNHPDAEPHFRELARQMNILVNAARQEFGFMNMMGESTYDRVARLGTLQILRPGEWHLPFVTQRELKARALDENIDSSVARCARTSYKLLDTGKLSDIASDQTLCAKLYGSSPMHLSPTEHPAQALSSSERVGNFTGFSQFRKTIPHEAGGDGK